MTTQKTSIKYECINCDFICSKKGDYSRHLSTQKHLRLQYTTNFTSHQFT